MRHEATRRRACQARQLPTITPTMAITLGVSAADGIEWEDDMVEVNRSSTNATMHWRFLDRTAGVDSTAIDWRFSVGQRVKIQLMNEIESDRPMHHPFHLHGAGRFLVLARDGRVSRTWCGRTRCLSALGRPWTSCSTSATPACGWRPPRAPEAHAKRDDVQLHDLGRSETARPNASASRVQSGTSSIMLRMSSAVSVSARSG